MIVVIVVIVVVVVALVVMVVVVVAIMVTVTTWRAGWLVPTCPWDSNWSKPFGCEMGDFPPNGVRNPLKWQVSNRENDDSKPTRSKHSQNVSRLGLKSP